MSSRLVIVISYLIIVLGIGVGILIGSAFYALFCALGLVAAVLTFHRQSYLPRLFGSFEGALVIAACIIIVGGIALGVEIGSATYALFCALMLVVASLIFYPEILFYPRMLARAVGSSLQTTEGWQAYTRQALDELRQDRTSAALASADEAARLNPSLHTVYQARALAQLAHGDHHAVIADTTEALRLNPGFAPALLLRAASHTALAQHDEAVSDYAQVLDQPVSDRTRTLAQAGLADALLERGLGHFRADQFDAALADFEAAESANPDLNLALAGQAVVFHALGEFDAALSTWDVLAATDLTYTRIETLAARFGDDDPFVVAARQIIAANGT